MDLECDKTVGGKRRWGDWKLPLLQGVRQVRDPTVGFVFAEVPSGLWAFLGSGNLGVRVWEVR